MTWTNYMVETDIGVREVATIAEARQIAKDSAGRATIHRIMRNPRERGESVTEVLSVYEKGRNVR